MFVMTDTPNAWHWSEADSQAFLEYGHFFVPAREEQISTICALIPALSDPFTVVELACGEGLLAGALLAHFPQAQVLGLDGSDEMLQRAAANLQQFGTRFQTQPFELAATDWRTTMRDAHAVVSSLTIHHLDAPGKQALFRDVCGMLAPGGVFVIADLVLPATERGIAAAAQAWDDAVQQRSHDLGGDDQAWTYFQQWQWNYYRYPDDGDKPSPLWDQLQWLAQAGFVHVDVAWMHAGHAIFSGAKPER